MKEGVLSSLVCVWGGRGWRVGAGGAGGVAGQCEWCYKPG